MNLFGPLSALAPLYALGALAVLAPILFHLIQKRPKGQLKFSSLMFLKPSPPTLTRRSRIDNWLLLLLRALVLLLLALAFIRPLWRWLVIEEMQPPGRRMLVLVDTSASMQREDLWRRAGEEVAAQLDNLQEGDQIALYSFDRDLTPLVRFEDTIALPLAARKDAVRNALGKIKPSSAGTDLGLALASASQILQETSGLTQGDNRNPPQVVLVSDMQAGASLGEMALSAWPENVQLVMKMVQPEQTTNASVSLLAVSEEVEDTSADAAPETVRVRIANASDSTGEQFEVAWVNNKQEPIETIRSVPAHVPPGESRVVKLPPAPEGAVGLRVAGDDHPFDNLHFVAKPVALEKSVVFLGPAEAKEDRGPLFFLRNAPLDSSNQTVRVEALTKLEPTKPLSPSATPLVVVASPLQEEWAELLAEYVQSGGRVLILLTKGAAGDTSSATTLAEIAGLDVLEITEAVLKDYALLSKIQFRHPLFAPFADPRFSDFTKIHFWSHRVVTSVAKGTVVEPAEDFPEDGAEPWQVVAEFDTKTPALLERRQGDGILWVLAAGWHPEESELARSSKFVPLLAGMVEYGDLVVNHTASYPLDSPIRFGQSSQVSVTDADGNQVSLESGEPFLANSPGLFTLAASDAQQAFAVNMIASESNTAPMSVDELEQYGVQLTAPQTSEEIAQAERQLHVTELESQQQLWRMLLIAALVVLGFEIVLAGWLSGRTDAAPAAS